MRVCVRRFFLFRCSTLATMFEIGLGPLNPPKVSSWESRLYPSNASSLFLSHNLLIACTVPCVWRWTLFVYLSGIFPSPSESVLEFLVRDKELRIGSKGERMYWLLIKHAHTHTHTYKSGIRQKGSLISQLVGVRVERYIVRPCTFLRRSRQRILHHRFDFSSRAAALVAA